MVPGGRKSEGAVAGLTASCAAVGRAVLLAVIAVVLVLSLPLSVTAHPDLASAGSRKASRAPAAKIKAPLTAAKTFSPRNRAASRRAARSPSFASISSPAHDATQLVFRPLRC